MADFGSATMSREDIQAFLTQPENYQVGKMLFASVASLRKDGSPFVVPLGFWCDGDYLYLTIGKDRTAAKRMQRDPRVAITLYNWTFPVKFVTITGRVEQIDDPEYEISLKIHRRYPKDHVIEDAEQDERNWLSMGKAVFRISLDGANGMDLDKSSNLGTEAAMMPNEARRLRDG